jgi:WhiB family transcriptional regulator, redox-sensing transcriptional regulator
VSSHSRAIEVMGWHPEIPGRNLDDFDEPTWRDLALCAETDPELFFVEKGGTARPAKRICGQCEVRAECLEFALEHNEGFGIWGGLTERERGMVKRGMSDIPDAPVVPAAPQPCHAGHLRTPDNVYSDGSCRTCKLDRDREKREAERLARAGGTHPGRDSIGRFAHRADQNAAA